MAGLELEALRDSWVYEEGIVFIPTSQMSFSTEDCLSLGSASGAGKPASGVEATAGSGGRRRLPNGNYYSEEDVKAWYHHNPRKAQEMWDAGAPEPAGGDEATAGSGEAAARWLGGVEGYAGGAGEPAGGVEGSADGTGEPAGGVEGSAGSAGEPAAPTEARMLFSKVLTLGEVATERGRRGWQPMSNRVARDCLMRAQAKQQPIVNVEETGFDWRWYLASQENYAEIFRDGDIVQFLGAQLKQTSDPNQGGRPRFDFMAFTRNGNVWRLHPGSTRGSSAKPVFARIRAVAASGGAIEPALPPPEQAARLTFENAVEMAQQDKLGKETARQELQRIYALLEGGAAEPTVRRMTPIDITEPEGDTWRWWRWVANLGRHTRRVIGPGIVRVQVGYLDNNDAMDLGFIITRIDESRIWVTVLDRKTVVERMD